MKTVDTSKLKKVELTPSERRDMLQKSNTKKPRSKKKRPTGPKEGVIQDQVEGYLNLKGIRFLHIPDVVYRMVGSPKVPVWDKAVISKYLKGAPDLMIFKKEMFSDNVPCDDNSCLILELKRKNGKARDSQKAWHKGLIVHVPQSFEEARTLIDRWSE